MYTAFYGLREKPFSLSPDPRFLFFADAHREALAHLHYGLEQNEGFIAITGEVGTGKTTICRTLLERLGDDTEIAFLFNPPRSATELLQAIAMEFGLPPAGRQRHTLNDQLNRFLLEKKSQGRRVLLIIDEAQNLDADVLEEVRLLSNLETASSKLIQILLLGQPELDRKLDSESLRQLRQRISVRWHLQPLSRAETAAYVAHRLEVAAGGTRDIFSPGALREIHRGTDGVPRRINLLCDRTLLSGYAAGRHRIDRKTVRRAGKELTHARREELGGGGLVWPARALALTALIAIAVGLGLWTNSPQRLRSWVDGVPEPAAVSSALVVDETQVEARVDAIPESAPSAPDASVSENEAGTRQIADVGAGPETVAGEPMEIARLQPDPQALDRALQPVPGAAPADRPVGSRAQRVANTLRPGAYLGRLIDGRDDPAARLSSLNAALDAFGQAPYLDAPEGESEILDWLEHRGLSVFEISDADLEMLRTLNHPAVLPLRGELGEARMLTLRGLDEELGELYGLTAEGSVEVPLHEIDEQWEGVAYVIWEAFEPIPELLVIGQRGRGVVWLQTALAELGLYQGEPSGLFDRATHNGVISLQARYQLEPDGAVGPRTQMVLYDLLERYPVPRLRDAKGSAG